MAVKTITIDMEAYDLLVSRKRPGESFSKVIKRTLRAKTCTAGEFLDSLDTVQLDDETLDLVDRRIRDRNKYYPAAVTPD
jgi:predicted CopG family antitoxin